MRKVYEPSAIANFFIDKKVSIFTLTKTLKIVYVSYGRMFP